MIKCCNLEYQLYQLDMFQCQINYSITPNTLFDFQCVCHIFGYTLGHKDFEAYIRALQCTHFYQLKWISSLETWTKIGTKLH